MKRYLSILLMSAALLGGMTSCMDDFDEPDVSGFSITSPTSVGEPTISIGELKQFYCASPQGATFSRNSSNWEFRIDEDVVIEGVICCNDGPYGNLYQNLTVRSIDSDGDQAIDVVVKNTCLYPYFPIGQRIRINLKGLYVGVYSRSPRIGYPYYTSSGNHNLGPIPFEMCATNFELIGAPDPTLPECQPVDRTGEDGYNWLRATANRTIDNYPMIVTVEGRFINGDDVSILAPDELEDAGYAVNRDFALKTSTSGNTTNIFVRTGTGNEISHLVMPKDKTVRLTGWFTYDSFDNKWQINLRDTKDFVILDE